MSRKTSQKRTEANRRNAQKSTGPRTPEGKARSSQNATTHGLSSLSNSPLNPACLLHMEDKDQFLGLLNEYMVTYRPEHRDELDLLTEAVFAKWRQQRLWLAETNQLEVAIVQNEKELQRALPAATSSAHLANGIAKSEQVLKLYLRYDAQLHRHYRNCLKDLRDLQDRRALQPEPEPEPPIEPKPPVTATEIPTPEPQKTDTRSEPKLTPEEACVLAEKAKIRRLMEINHGLRPLSPGEK